MSSRKPCEKKPFELTTISDAYNAFTECILWCEYLTQRPLYESARISLKKTEEYYHIFKYRFGQK